MHACLHDDLKATGTGEPSLLKHSEFLGLKMRITRLQTSLTLKQIQIAPQTRHLTYKRNSPSIIFLASFTCIQCLCVPHLLGSMFLIPRPPGSDALTRGHSL